MAEQQPTKNLFVVRVELHGGKEPDYEKLHGFMAEQGFSKEVSLSGKLYKLPTAEYIVFSSETVDQVKNRAIQASAKTVLTASIIANKSADWASHGLIPVLK